jgi:uncharacterized protein (UPF0262 family)
MGMPDANPFRIVDIQLDERTVVRRTPEIDHDRAVAIFDLLEENHFKPVEAEGGPFVVHLSIEEGRLVMDILEEDGSRYGKHILSLRPLSRAVKDYFEICASYYDAIKTASPQKIEALDMARRGVHNEAAELLKDRLASKVEVDMDTARRLFTLISVLHLRPEGVPR